MKIKNLLLTFCGLCTIFSSCKSIDFDKMGTEADRDYKEYDSFLDEQKANYEQTQDYLIEEKLKEVDVEKTVVYVEKPVYYPANEKSDKPGLKGTEAARQSTKESMQVPSSWTGGTMYYDFDNDFTYEIYCQPYRVTDLILEPGEQVIEMPFLSEEKVWEIGAGVSRSNGTDTQHFFLKPAFSGLETSFIIITDRRVYHLMLRSFKNCYMTQVRWKYPNTMPFNLKTEKMKELEKERINSLETATTSVNPAYLSFDYKMSYSFFKKPYWLPTRIYDDGKKTYVVMNETVLHMTTPVLFNNRNEKINYSVNKNLIVINELIEKVTMRVGKEKVTIKKKSYKEPKEVKIEKTEEITLDKETTIPEKNLKNNFNSVYNSKLKKETLLHSNDLILETPTFEELKKEVEEELKNNQNASSEKKTE